MLKKIFNKILIFVRDKYVEYRIKKNISEKEKFSIIYNSGYWKGFNKGSLSGTGSSSESTNNIRKYLQKFINANQIKSLLDIPCGDFYWLSKLNLSNIQYIGADIVDEIILDNQNNHTNKNLTFINLDIINGELPMVDLIFVRDCFVHLKNEQIIKALKNIINSNSKFLATTTFVNTKNYLYSSNADRWRPINMCQEPFNLPKPLELLNDTPLLASNDQDKYIGVWKISNLKLNKL